MKNNAVLIFAFSVCGCNVVEGVSQAVDRLDAANVEIDTISNEKPSEILGSGIMFNDRGDIDVRAVEGSIDSSTNKVALNNGHIKFTSQRGFEESKATDGQNTIDILATDTSYQYMKPYHMRYKYDGVDHQIVGVFGHAISSSAMPTAGSASFKGPATTTITNRDSKHGTEIGTGSATIEANFSDGTVDVTTELSHFQNSHGGSISDPSVDTISRNGMRIRGNSFTGGTETYFKDGDSVDPIGSNKTSIARGHFFGPSTKYPVEVGGTSVAKGDDGLVTNLFLGN